MKRKPKLLRKSSRLIFIFVFVFLSFILFLFIADAYLLLLVTDVRAITMTDHNLQYRNRPFSETYDYAGWFENRKIVHYYIGQFGERTNGNGEEKHTQKPTILCFGDSNTFGQGVEFEDTYPALLQSTLANQYHVFNFGVLGYNAYQNYRHAEQMSQQLIPNLLIAQFCGNDDNITTPVLQMHALPWPLRTRLGIMFDSYMFSHKFPLKSYCPFTTEMAVKNFVLLAQQLQVPLIIVFEGYPPSFGRRKASSLLSEMHTKHIDVIEFDAEKEYILTYSGHLNRLGNQELAHTLAEAIFKIIPANR